MTSAADVEAFGAFDKKTQLYETFCMEKTPGFSDWVKRNIADGLEVHHMTVGQIFEWLDKTKAAA